MDKRMQRNLGVTVLAVLSGAAILISCRRDFESPYLPGASDYAGDEWTRDEDGDGVADSLERYAPDCALPPRQCIETGKTLSRISRAANSLSARDMVLWLGDTARAPFLVWIPAEGSVRGYLLASSDSSKVKPENGRLLPVAAGNAQISVSVPGADTLFATFIASVAASGKKVAAVSVRDLSLAVGRDSAPAVTWMPSDPLFKDFSLRSERPEVARVVDRKIRGMAPGKAAITLETLDGGYQAIFTADVTAGPATVPTASISAEDMYLVRAGPASAPLLHWLPENVTDKGFKLISLDTGIAIILDKTRVAPVAPGNARVLVLGRDGGGKTAEFTVYVSAQAVAVQGLFASNLVLAAGADAVAPLLSWLPANASNRKYSLSSGDTSVAQARNGKILPLSMGVAEFVVTCLDGGFRDTFTVSVGPRDPAEHVDSLRVADLAVPLGADRKPVIAWYPADAGNQGYALQSRDTAIATASGGTVHAVKAGTAEFLLTSHDNARTAVFQVTVYAPDIPARLISVDTLYLVAGEDRSPTLTWTPSDATNLKYNLISLDTAYASIASGLRVHAKAVGAARIQVVSQDGPTTIFTAMVSAKAIRLVSLACPAFTLNLGDAPWSPAVVFTPTAAANRTVTFRSPAGNGILSVNAQNRVTVSAPGQATLTVVSGENPGITAGCPVTVTALAKSISALDDTLRLGSPQKDAAPRLAWTPPNVPDKSFSLVSDDTAVVRPNGRFYKAVGAGTTTVIARALDGSGKADTFTVRVQVPVTGVTAADHAMKTTDSQFNTAPLFAFAPANASDKGWSLAYADPDALPAPAAVVKIVNGWQLLPQGPGTARIQVASLDNAAAKDIFTVTVIRPVTGMTAAPISMKLGDPDMDAAVTFAPADVSDRRYILAGGSGAVATVVGNKIHAVGAGTATFTAVSVSDGARSADFLVTVAVIQPVISLSVGNMILKRSEGDKDPVILWNPANAPNKGYALSGGHQDVATVIANRIHPLAHGTAAFTATSLDGGKTASFLVTVTVPLEAISAPDIKIGWFDNDVVPDVQFKPADAQDKGYTLRSSDPSIAAIVNGKIRAGESTGTAEITLTSTENPSVFSTFLVGVSVF